MSLLLFKIFMDPIPLKMWHVLHTICLQMNRKALRGL